MPVSPVLAVRDRTVWLTFVPIVVLHALWVLTFPLNTRGGDTSNYFEMLVEGKSSLVHAGGYPFLVGLPFRHGPLAGLARSDPSAFAAVLLVFQHALSIAALAALFAFVRRLYGNAAAAAATLLVGTSTQFMGATSAVYPEWLQASLLVVAIWSASNAFYAASSRAKAAWYGASVVAFTWCVLTKFNGAVFAAAYLLPLVAERARLSRKLLGVAIYTLVAALNVALYLSVFHRPTTGTSRLTADAGWVLLTKTEHVYDNTLSADAGPHAKQWLVLASRLPKRYDVAGPELFRAVDAIPNEIRAPYRPLFEQVTRADEDTLDEMVAGARLPEGFSVGLSVIPVCYYVGLLEGSDLGVRVALETFRARPAMYVRNVIGDLWRATSTYRPYEFFPRDASMEALGFSAAQPHRWGVTRLRQPAVLPAVPYAYDKPLVWWPGVRLFDWLAALTAPAWAATACVLAAIGAATAWVVTRGVDAPAAVVITLGVSLAIFVVASSATLEFRWKEFCFVMPIVSMLAVVGVGSAATAGRRLLRHVTAA